MGSRDEDDFGKSFAASVGFPWDKSAHIPVPIDIHTAAAIGDYNWVRQYLEAGVDCNKANKGGWSPLMYAAYVGHDSITSLLLERPGINIDHQANDGSTALMWAAACANESVLYFLLQSKSSINLRDKAGRSALMHATQKGQQRSIKKLLEHGANIEIPNAVTGNTPLLEATHQGFETVTQILIDSGADVHARNLKGHSAEDIARNSETPKLAILSLLEKVLRKGSGGDLRSEAGLTLHSHDGPAPGPARKQGDLRAGPSALHSRVPTSQAATTREPPLQNLEGFLEHLQLTKYLELFQKEEVDFSTLLTMTEDDLKAIGITLFGPRRKISSAIKKWLEDNPGHVGPLQPAVAAAPPRPAARSPLPLIRRSEAVPLDDDVSSIAEEVRETFDLHVRREVSGLSSQVDILRHSLSEAVSDKLRLEKELESERHLRHHYEGQLVEIQSHDTRHQGQTHLDVSATARRVSPSQHHHHHHHHPHGHQVHPRQPSPSASRVRAGSHGGNRGPAAS